MPNSLRPSNFDEFIGQINLVETIKVMIRSSQKQHRALDHMLFYGPPGLGKTTIAMIIANDLGTKIRFAQGPLLEKKADVLSLFSSISPNEVIFVDEIHNINRQVEELFYSALDSGFIDVMIGVEGDSKFVRLKLPNFTFLAATTKINLLSRPLKDRFGLIGKLTYYNEQEMQEVVRQSASKLKLHLSDEAVILVSIAAQRIPRVANNLLKRILDFKIDEAVPTVNEDFVKKVFTKIGIFQRGLLANHITYLEALSADFHNEWVPIDAICGILLETKAAIEQDVEPLLLKFDFISKSSRGRRITNAGLNYLRELKQKSI